MEYCSATSLPQKKNLKIIFFQNRYDNKMYLIYLQLHSVPPQSRCLMNSKCTNMPNYTFIFNRRNIFACYYEYENYYYYELLLL